MSVQQARNGFWLADRPLVGRPGEGAGFGRRPGRQARTPRPDEEVCGFHISLKVFVVLPWTGDVIGWVVPDHAASRRGLHPHCKVAVLEPRNDEGPSLPTRLHRVGRRSVAACHRPFRCVPRTQFGQTSTQPRLVDVVVRTDALPIHPHNTNTVPDRELRCRPPLRKSQCETQRLADGRTAGWSRQRNIDAGDKW